MDKQSTAAFILIGLILVVWLYFNAPQPVENNQKAADSTLVAEKEISTPEKPEPAKVETESSRPKVSAEGFAPSNEPGKVITIETDLAKFEFTSSGGRLRKYYLKNYKTWYYRQIKDTSDFYNTHVQLISPKEGGDFNLIFITKDGILVNTKDLSFNSDLKKSYYRVKAGDSLTVNYKYATEKNNAITKAFVIYGNDYASKVDIVLENMNDVISSYRYDVEWANGLNFLEENSVDEANYSNAAAYSGEEKVVIDASTAGEDVTKVLNGKVDWIGIRNKYFTTIIAPDKPNHEGGADFKGEHILTLFGNREIYSASLKIPFNNSNYQKDSYQLYMGPIEYTQLQSYNKNYQAIFEFGSFFGLHFVTRPISEFILLPLFKFLHRFIPNYGFVIIVFSIIIKFALYPLTRQSYKSMKRMQQLQPKIAELKEKHKDDQQKVQKETMKLYSTYGINPAGGCLPMVLQMPILFALFTFFNVAIEIRHEPFMFWITNLSSPDIILKLPFTIPLFGISAITGLAPLLGVTMFLQQKMSTKDPSQKALVYIMPFMFTFMFMGFTSGLNLYYFMFNLFSIIQQYYINNQKGDEELVPVKNPKKKSGFMQRMMEAAEQQQKSQKQSLKKKNR